MKIYPASATIKDKIETKHNFKWSEIFEVFEND